MHNMADYDSVICLVTLQKQFIWIFKSLLIFVRKFSISHDINFLF